MGTIAAEEADLNRLVQRSISATLKLWQCSITKPFKLTVVAVLIKQETNNESRNMIAMAEHAGLEPAYH